MNSRDALKDQIVKKAVVHGKVILSSGKEADYYVDLRRVTLDHEAAPLVGEVMLELTKDLDYEAVGGLTLGADPVATAMMHVAASKAKRLIHLLCARQKKHMVYNVALKARMLKAREFLQLKILQQQVVLF